jgi:hypothetical protein
MSISSAFHGDDDAKAAFLVHASLLPPRDRNRSQYLTRSSLGFERLFMATPMSLCHRVVASSPNLLPKLLEEGSSGHFVLAVHASRCRLPISMRGKLRPPKSRPRGIWPPHKVEC